MVGREPGAGSGGWGVPRPAPTPGTRAATPLSRSRTSAADVGLRASLPWKITSCICSPRRLFALCSPSTQVMASTTLLFPQPLGPTMAVTPVSNASSDRSGKLLKPAISRRFKRILLIQAAQTDYRIEAAGNASHQQVFGIHRLDNGRYVPGAQHSAPRGMAPGADERRSV